MPVLVFTGRNDKHELYGPLIWGYPHNSQWSQIFSNIVKSQFR